MTSACGDPPEILNGEYVTQSPITTVKYKCFSGFTMTGTNVLTCSSSKTWGDPPTCSPISDSDNIYVDNYSNWWWYFLAAWLSVLLLAALITLIYCCYCRSGYRLNFSGGSGSGATCCTGKGSAGCCRCCRRQTAVDDDHRSVSFVENGDVVFIPVRMKPGAMYKNSPPAVHPQSTTVQSSSPQELTTETEEEFSPRLARAVKAANAQTASQPVRMWMPHTHPVRNINTSTK